MSQTKKKIPWRQFVGMAFVMLIGAICGIIMVTYIANSDADAPLYEKLLSLAGLFIGMYVAMFFHVIIHEAGHLIFGLLTGYKFSSFRVFSFMWLNENGKIKLKRLSLAGTGGQCLMVPPDMKDGKIPIILYNLGGVIVNLTSGALFLAIYLLLSDIPPLSHLLLIFSVVGFMTAMMNGIPMRMGTVDNDGYNALSMSKNRKAMEAFWVQLKIVELTSKGVRLKDMPKEWFAVPSDEDMKNSLVATRGVFACNRLIDEGCPEEAAALMSHLLEIDSGIVGLHRNLIVCDRICIELLGEARREVIDELLTKEQKKFMKSMKTFPSVIRTEYALAVLFYKDMASAERARSEFEKVAKTYPYPHELIPDRELMDEIKKKI